MIIYLDESKKINKGKRGQYIFGGLITIYKSGTIDKIYNEFLEYSGIKYKGELKSNDRFYKKEIEVFYEFLELKGYMKNIEFCGIYIDEYKENGKNYIEMLSILSEFIIEKSKFKNNFSVVQIIADNLKLNINEKAIKNILNNNLNFLVQKKYIKKLGFAFFNSKKYGGLAFADFISGIIKKEYIDNKEKLDYDFIKYFTNKEIKIIKYLNK